ncbi:hypothetical protein T439DRAFT_322770 [Meredithblackwellia eburnea MCA 4105]
MAGVLVLAVFQGGLSLHNAVQDRRSPLLPLPPQDEGVSRHTTERDLKRIFRAWQARQLTLEAKVRGLKIAKSKGQDICWAGPVRSLRAARKARDEARWVTVRLEKAVEWCKEQQVKKGGYSVVAVSRSSPRRPSHTATPPALFELPFPLPQALPTEDYTLTVVRPIVEPPPAYSPDCTDGEKMLLMTEIEHHERRPSSSSSSAASTASLDSDEE